jgi:hypothetical protein
MLWRDEEKCAHSLVRKSEGKNPFERPRHRREVNTEIDIRSDWIRMCGLDSMGSGQGPAVVSCKYSTEPSDSINDQEFIDHQSHYQLVKEFFH